MPLDAFLDTAWKDHGDRPQEVAERLASSLHLVEADEHVAPFARLLTHVCGDHLGQWHGGVALLDALRARRGALDAAAARAIDIGVATLRYGNADVATLAALPAQDRVVALSNAASALAARDEFSRAIGAYEEALQTARAERSAEPAAMRALAVGGNNLAVALEARNDRSASETRAMLSAAESALLYWKQVGTWLEEERAEYRLARIHLQAGEAKAAVPCAERCVAVCERNGAPPFEKFFAHAVLACAHRASGNAASFADHRQAALSCLQQVPEDERQWCESERKGLDG